LVGKEPATVVLNTVHVVLTKQAPATQAIAIIWWIQPHTSND